jgi:hypothetical protein
VQGELSETLANDMSEFDGPGSKTGGDTSSRSQELFLSLLNDSQFLELTVGTNAASGDSSKK